MVKLTNIQIILSIVSIIFIILLIMYFIKIKEKYRILIPEFGTSGYRWRGSQVITGDTNFDDNLQN